MIVQKLLEMDKKISYSMMRSGVAGEDKDKRTENSFQAVKFLPIIGVMLAKEPSFGDIDVSHQR